MSELGFFVLGFTVTLAIICIADVIENKACKTK